LEIGHSGRRCLGGAAALLHRGAPKAPIIPAQPSGLGTQTADVKALKARSVVSAIGASERGLLAGCETNIMHATISENGPRRWRLGLLLVGYLGHCPRLIWVGPLARVAPRRGMDNAIAGVKCPKSRGRRTAASPPACGGRNALSAATPAPRSATAARVADIAARCPHHAHRQAL